MLANLDNEVIFKKLFSDKEILAGFVKDVLGIEINNPKIEVRKPFQIQIDYSDFKFDIYSESYSSKKTVVVHRIEYDYDFNEDLLEFLIAFKQVQQKYTSNKINQAVYGIVVLTAPYIIRDNTPIKDKTAITDLNVNELKRAISLELPKKVIFLNPYKKTDNIEHPSYKWLNLFYKSIHTPKELVLSTSNLRIKQASEIIHIDQLSGEEWDLRFKAESRKIAKKYRETSIREEAIKKKFEQNSYAKETINVAIRQGISIKRIVNLSNIPTEYVEEVAREMRDKFKKEEGIEKGIEMVITMAIKQGKKRDEERASFTGISIEKIRQVRKMLEDE